MHYKRLSGSITFSYLLSGIWCDLYRNKQRINQIFKWALIKCLKYCSSVEEVQLSWYSIRHSTDVLSSTAELIETNSIHFKFWNSFKNFVCVLSVTLLVVVPVFWCQMCAGLEQCSASHLINFVQRVKLKSRYVQTILWISWENMFHAGCGASRPDVLQWDCYDISPTQDT